MPYQGLCLNIIPARSRSWPAPVKRCSRPAGHDGRCDEVYFLHHLRSLGGLHRQVAEKINRDSFNTTGAAWGSDDAGPNRMPRHVAGLPRNQLNQALISNGYPPLDQLANPEKITDKGASREA
ncbi:MAG: hypothetical protein ACPHJE_03285, partial [Poseidonia sp.]